MSEIKISGIVRHLLIVDDDVDNLELFTLILQNYHFNVDAYSDPLQAFLEFKANCYDLIILDYFMPVLNGMELYKRIKEIDKRARVIFLTASFVELYANKEALETIRKPIRMGEFLQHIKSALTPQVKSELLNSQTNPIPI